MNALVALLTRRRLVLVLVTLLVLVGALKWNTMPRQEDPSFKTRIATVVVRWPGADPLRVERLVVRPIEDGLADVPELRKISVTARTDGAAFLLELRDAIADTGPVWDAIRESLDDVAQTLPDGAGPIELNEKQGDPSALVFLVTGTHDLLALRSAARDLEDALLKVDGVSRVERLGDPGEQVRVALDPGVADRLGLDPQTVAGALRARNAVVPAGAAIVDGRRAVLAPRAELLDVDALRATPWILPDGSAVPLGELARISLGPVVPPRARLYHDRRPAVGVSVIPELPQDLVSFGERVEEGLAAIVPELSARGLVVHTFSSQPEHVERRLGSLTRTLLASVLVVAGVLLLAMGVRLGLVVASIVPLVTLGAVAVYATAGGVLHQISVASIVLALGLLVDNAIVVAETVQRHLDDGLAPWEAARRAIQELAVPLGTATGTTVAAFVPMLASEGVTADFTRAVPIVVVTALVLSYGFAMAVTPALAALVQRPTVRGGASRWLDRWSLRLGEMVVVAPLRATLLVAVVLLSSLALLPTVSQQFFPFSDRSRVIVTVELPEGVDLTETERVVTVLEDELVPRSDVVSVTSFVGQKVPRFYYNLTFPPAGPHRATLVVTAPDVASIPGLLHAVRESARQVPEATVVPKRLQQGPPAGAPVEVRLSGEELPDLQAATEAVMTTLRAHPATRDVRHDLGVGSPRLGWSIDDAAAGRRGLARRDVALSLLGRTQGLPAGEVRGGRDPVPVVVTTPAGERTDVAALSMTTIGAPGATAVPIAAIATEELTWGPASIHRRDRSRVVTVSAQLAEGATFSEISSEIEAFRDGVPASVSVDLGGEAERSSEANTALLSAVPIGLGILLLFLFLEFDSLRRVGIVLVTVPLAAVGVVPGLALSGEPFGFMSLLGVISLVGIVVNNAIVLIDVIERERRSGTAVRTAIVEAIRLRTRPILLTTATTVAGMLPLALSSSPLWPPLAWAIISGLVASTALTLVAVPALYRLLCGEESPPWLGRLARGIGLGAALLVVSMPARAGVTLEEALVLGEEAPASTATQAAARAARAEARTAVWAAFGPSVGAEGSAWRRDNPLELSFTVPPDGPALRILQQPDELVTLGAEVRVPLFDPAAIARIGPARRSEQGARAIAARARHLSALGAAEAWLDVRIVDAQRDANLAYVEALRSLHQDLLARYAAALVVESDVLRAEVALLDADQQARSLDRQREVATRRLGAALGRAEPVEPLGVLPTPPAGDVSAAPRSDLIAADARIAARRGERRAVFAEGLPMVEVYGAYRTLDQENLVDGDWVEAGVRARWTLIARGTRPGRRRALGARIAEAEAERTRLALGIEVEQSAAQAALEVSQSEVAVRERAVTQATVAAEQVSDRYRQGLVTLTDLLEVQAELRNQRTRHEVAKIEEIRAALQRQVALGHAPTVD